MSSTIAQINACCERNGKTIARIEALKGVKPFAYSLEWPALAADDFDKVKHGLLRPKVVEFQRENVATVLKEWRFTGTLRNDFLPFIRGINWTASSWDEIKRLNVDIKDVAQSIAEHCKDNNGDLLPSLAGEFAKFLDNLEGIETELTALEEDIAGGTSRSDQLQRMLSDKDKEWSDFIIQCGFRSPPHSFSVSSILETASMQQQLSTWFPGGWKLLYKGSRDGMNAESFHTLVDGKGPTLTVIQVRDQSGENVFGGYTQVSWRRSGGSTADAAASLFVLKSSLGIEPQRLPLVSSSSSCAVYHDAYYGPTFGGSFDIALFGDDFSGDVDYSSNSYTYVSGSYYQNTTGQGAYVFTGGIGEYFTPSEVEVFAKIDQVV